MFELDREIDGWRSGLERGSSLSLRELDELEDHLRARVDLELDLNPALTPATAFRSALEGLGEASAISKEFAKAGQPRWRRLLLTGWALYAASFLLPAFGLPVIPSRPDAARTIYGYEVFQDLLQPVPDGPALLLLMLWLPNLIMLLTLPALRHLRPWRRPWAAWIVGATGALPLGLGVLRLANGGLGYSPGVGFWVWSASFLVVATALWLRSRERAPARPQLAPEAPRV